MLLPMQNRSHRLVQEACPDQQCHLAELAGQLRLQAVVIKVCFGVSTKAARHIAAVDAVIIAGENGKGKAIYPDTLIRATQSAILAIICGVNVD